MPSLDIMFDVGFSELIVIGIVALVVIGPERLPRVARTVGHLLGRAQRYVNDVKADINREMQLEELRKLQEQVTDSARALENSMRQGYDAARSTVEDPLRAVAAEAEAGLKPDSETPAETPAENIEPVALTEGSKPTTP